MGIAISQVLEDKELDQKAKGVVLQPGDRNPVKDLSEHRGPEKIRPHWGKVICVVKEQVADNAVYVGAPESGGQQKIN